MTRPVADKSPVWRENKPKGKILLLNYKDMSFCASDCKTRHCARHFDDLDDKAAKAWWGGNGDAPIAFQDHTKGCAQYQSGGTDMPLVVTSAIKTLEAL